MGDIHVYDSKFEGNAGDGISNTEVITVNIASFVQHYSSKIDVLCEEYEENSDEKKFLQKLKECISSASSLSVLLANVAMLGSKFPEVNDEIWQKLSNLT